MKKSPTLVFNKSERSSSVDTEKKIKEKINIYPGRYNLNFNNKPNPRAY